MSEWQPIETAPKEEGVSILVWDAYFRKPVVVKLISDNWWPGYGAEYRPKEVTHWMPLPEPPK